MQKKKDAREKRRKRKKTQKKKDAKEKRREKKKGGMMYLFFYENRHEAKARIMRPAYIMPVKKVDSWLALCIIAVGKF